MSLLSSFTNPSKLKAANANVTSARASEGKQADHLFSKAYQSYAEIVGENDFLSETLYHWGFALFNQARTKSGEEAELRFQDAFDKFSFALLANPESLKPAIDWGAALMALAEKKQVGVNDALYDQAIEKFMTAEKIFRGSASYNLACIYAMRGDDEQCRQALEASRDHSSLPEVEAILNDADLDNVKQNEWFEAFITSLQKPAQKAAEPKGEASPAEETAEKKAGGGEQ